MAAAAAAAAAVQSAQPIINGSNPNDAGHAGMARQDSAITIPEYAHHPDEVEILRRAEYYFSDDNICSDRNLLGLIKEGNGTVSFNEICSFKKMRQYKPKSAVKDVIRTSTLVKLSEDGKRLSRRYPPAKPITVTPKINSHRRRGPVVPDDKPWLTKGMMKPTGFEANITNGPIKPEEYEEDRKEYDLDNGFAYRIEIAITRFCAGRKMHQETRNIFEKFLIFGGMDGGQRQFTGGRDESSMDDYTKKEIAELTAYYGVSERVRDGLEENTEPDGEATWDVDFEAVAKAFLSSQFTSVFDWYDGRQVKTATNVLKNFYNYLLYHDVCPEYKNQLLAARRICDQAEQGLPKLKELDSRLPGGFNCACSTLFEGNYANLYASGGDWVREEDNMGWSKENAERIFITGVFAHGTEEQVAKVEEATLAGTPINEAFKVVSKEEDVGLEIIAVEPAAGPAEQVYFDPLLSNTVARPMGKLCCKRWQVPHAKPTDLPKAVIEAQESRKSQIFEVIVEDSTLQYCIPGMKIECCIKGVDLGIKWIDYLDATYASFFTWLSNEKVRGWKEPGPPKVRRKDGDEALGEEAEAVGGEDEDFDDGMPD